MVDVDTILRQQQALSAKEAPVVKLEGPGFLIAMGAIALVVAMYFSKRKSKRRKR